MIDLRLFKPLKRDPSTDEDTLLLQMRVVVRIDRVPKIALGRNGPGHGFREIPVWSPWMNVKVIEETGEEAKARWEAEDKAAAAVSAAPTIPAAPAANEPNEADAGVSANAPSS